MTKRILVLASGTYGECETIITSLRNAGAEVDVIEYPTWNDDPTSLTIGSPLNGSIDLRDIRNRNYTAAIYHRAVRPQMREELKPSDDFNMASDNVEAYWTGLPGAIELATGPDCRWYNSAKATRAALSKGMQLQMALDCGLAIPPTLISNDPEKVRSFIDTISGQVVCKPLRLGAWKEERGYSRCQTFRLDNLDDEDFDSVRLHPSIFQQEIKKEYEIRSWYIDGDFLSMKIKLDDKGIADVDWRNAPLTASRCEIYELPETIKASARRFMSALSLTTGSFDFIKSPGGGFVFLEINPAGNFLFLEKCCPDLQILERFISSVLGRAQHLIEAT